MNEHDGKAGCVCILLVTSALACQPAELIEPASGGLSGVAPVVAVRSDQAVVAWHRAGQVRVSEYEAGAAWSAPQMLGAGTFPDVAVSSADSAITLFGNSNTLYASMRSGAGWSAPQSLGTWTALAYGVAQAADGLAVAVWSGGGSMRARSFSGGAWDSATVLRMSAAVARPQVAVNDSGVAFAAWCDSSGAMFGARRVHPGAWESAHASQTACCQAPAFDTPGPALSVGVSASGEALIVGGTATRLCGKRYVPGTGWQPTDVLATPGPDTTAPQVAVNPDGLALLTWTNFLGGGQLKVRLYDPGSGWGPTLSGPPVGTGRLGVGIGADGDGAVVYRSSASTISAVVYNNGALSQPLAVASTGSGSLYNLRVGYDPSLPSQGVSVWQRASGGEEVWASRLGL
jgi:hypothetical protein